MESRSSNNNIPDKRIVDSFSEDEREEIQKIWEAAGEIRRETPELEDQMIERDLGSTWNRIEKSSWTHTNKGRSRNGNRRRSKQPYTRRDTSWRWFLAAAMILIVFGAGYFILPKSYSVAYGETATVQLSDGTIVELNSGTQLWHNRLFGRTNRKVHLDGEAYFIVPESDRSFSVQANEALIQVSGTEFNVRSWSSDPGQPTQVTVSHGEVEFYSILSPDKRVYLSPGESSQWYPGLTSPTDPEPISMEKAIGWRNNMLMFTEQSLIVIFNELERKFNVQIELDDAELGNRTLTTHYSEPPSLETIIQDITVVKDLNFLETPNGYRIFR